MNDGLSGGADDEQGPGRSSRGSGTLVCFAVEQEATYFRRLVQDRGQVAVLRTGMGKPNAIRAVREALALNRPAQVITAGFAGGLDPALSFGAIVFQAGAETAVGSKLEAAGAYRARFHCADTILWRAEQKALLHRQSGAQAVEMESGAIHEVCAEFGIPVATVRVILDTAGEDLALDFNALLNANQELDGRKLALALLQSPAKIRALLRLQRQSKAAARRLAMMLGQVLG